MVITASMEAPPIDFGNGKPDESLLRPLHDVVLKATEHCLRRESEANSPLQYGDITFDATDATQHFRRQLSILLTRHYGYSVDPNVLFPTAGVSQAVDMLAAVSPGDVAVVSWVGCQQW